MSKPTITLRQKDVARALRERKGGIGARLATHFSFRKKKK